MSAAPQPRLSFDDWLAIERTATNQRSEYIAGEVLAMAGGTEDDRGDKFRHYRRIQSLQAYLLLSQYRKQAELFLRQPGGTWSLSSYQDPSKSIPLRVVEAELLLAEVYDKLELSR